MEGCATTSSGSSACSSCGEITVEPGADPAMSPTPTITTGTNEDGCATTTVTCDGFTANSIVILEWFFEGNSVGVSGANQDEIGTITRTLTCDTSGDFLVVEDGASQAVQTVQCFSTN